MSSSIYVNHKRNYTDKVIMYMDCISLSARKMENPGKYFNTGDNTFLVNSAHDDVPCSKQQILAL